MSGEAMNGGATGRRRVAVVAGMHRAGTSVVARALQALGVNMGERLMSADVRMNARGFFEDLDIVARNDALLAGRNADWKNVALLAEVDWTAADSAADRAEAQRILEARLAGRGQFGFKDPRVPRLLPFWQQVFAAMDIDAVYVIAVRHPRAVIDSLTARDALDVRRSGWLWLAHLLCALHYTEGQPRIVVDYDLMLAEPPAQLARIARLLAANGWPDARATGPEADVFAHGFLSGELRHAQYASGDLDPASVPALVPRAHALAQELARDLADPQGNDTAVAVDALWAGLLAQAPLLAYAGAAEHVADEAPRLTAELAWARESLARSVAYAESLREALAGKEADLTASIAYSEDLRRVLDRVEGELVAAHDALGRVRQNPLGRMLLRWVRR